MSVSPSHTRRLAVAVAAALALALPVAAGAATPGNPQVLRLNDTGAATVLAGGSPFTSLGGLAVSPTNTLYVANQGRIGPSPKGAGLYSLADASTVRGPATFSPLATTAPTNAPTDVVLDDADLYSMDNDKIISTSLSAPTTQVVLSSGQLYDSLGADPQFGAVSGNTLYTTADGSCASVGGGGAYVIAVNTITGVQTKAAGLGCASLGGLAVEASGTLLVAETNSNVDNGKPGVPRIVRVNPATGAVTVLKSGTTKSLLRTPQGVYLAGDANLYVADSTAGIIQVNPTTGHQFLFSKPGGKSPLGNAFGITQGTDGTIYVSEAGVPPVLTASASTPQKLSSRGIRLTAACSATCTVAYDAAVSISGGLGYAQDAAFKNVKAMKSQYVKLPSSVNKRIASALTRGKTVSVVLTLTAQDPNSGASGTPKKLPVRVTR